MFNRESPLHHSSIVNAKMGGGGGGGGGGGKGGKMGGGSGRVERGGGVLAYLPIKQRTK